MFGLGKKPIDYKYSNQELQLLERSEESNGLHVSLDVDFSPKITIGFSAYKKDNQVSKKDFIEMSEIFFRDQLNDSTIEDMIKVLREEIASGSRHTWNVFTFNRDWPDIEFKVSIKVDYEDFDTDLFRKEFKELQEKFVPFIQHKKEGKKDAGEIKKRERRTDTIQKDIHIVAANIEKQKEKILQKLDELYGFGCIEDFVSLDLVLDAQLTYSKNVKLLKDYLSDELMVSVRGPEIERIIGNEFYLLLKEHLSSDEFEHLMNEKK